MNSFRFLHCADLHLDSPLRGLEADPDAPAQRIRGATRDAFRGLVDYAIDNRVDFIVAAGDLYDGEWQDWRTGQFLVREVGRLSEAGIPFISIRGNHDAQSIISRQLTLPPPAREFGAAAPEMWELAGLRVRIHGQSFATQAVRENLSRAYRPPEPGWFNIGLLHTNVDGWSGHENYAPSNLTELRNHGYHYWALGHIHTRTILAQDPWIIYPGNIQGRHLRETGPKGAMLVSVQDGRIAQPPMFVAFDTVRWDRVAVDATAADDEEALLTLVRSNLTAALDQAGERLLAARLEVTGATRAHVMLNRDLGAFRDRVRAEAAILAGAERIWVEGVSVNVTPPRSLDIATSDLMAKIQDFDFADLDGTVRKYCQDMLDRAAGLRDALGSEHPAVSLLAGGRLPDELVKRARDLLLARLAER